MAKITGRVEVLVNNDLLLNKAGAVASGLGLSGEPNFEKEAIVGDSGLHGFVDRPVMAQCEVTITDRDDILLDSLARVDGNGTVIFRAANGGKSYTMQQATCTRNFTLTAGDGEVPVIFQGPYWVEDVSAT